MYDAGWAELKTMKIGKKYIFTPGLVPTLVTLLLLVLLINLGLWQLRRADFKYKLRADRNHNATLPLIELTASLTDLDRMVQRKVRLRGEFVSGYQAALANIKYKHNPGFFVVQPFRLQGSTMHVLVITGWVRQVSGFNRLPPMPATPPGKRVLTGVVDRKPAVGIEYGTPDAGFPQWPKLLTYINIDWYRKQLGKPFLPYVVKQYGAVSQQEKTRFGLVRDWKFFASQYEIMPPEKHVSYAFQWFSLALVLFGIYLGVNIRRAGTTASEPDSELQ